MCCVSSSTRVKRVKLAELKMAGVEYEERIAELEKLEYPKPLRELVYETFNEFRQAHPWVRDDDVRPKSIARDMFERFMDFNEYVREYELGRAEGTLLRYLSDAYKALVQTVPAPAKTPEVEEIEVFLRAVVRSVDSSLLDEWERILAGPEALVEKLGAPLELTEPDITRDERGFTVLVRNAMFQLVKALARRDWQSAAAMVTAPVPSAFRAVRPDCRGRRVDRRALRAGPSAVLRRARVDTHRPHRPGPPKYARDSPGPRRTPPRGTARRNRRTRNVGDCPGLVRSGRRGRLGPHLLDRPRRLRQSRKTRCGHAGHQSIESALPSETRKRR